MSPYLLICLIALAAGTAAAETATSPLPDPYGLGQRLVMIDDLRRLGVAIPDGASDAELRALHQAAALPGPMPEQAVAPVLSEGPIDETALSRDLHARQRRVLKEKYGVEAPDGLDERELNALLAEQARQREQRAQEAVERLAAQEDEHQRQDAAATAAALVTRRDGPPGTIWTMPRFTEAYDARRSPYLACRFGTGADGRTGPMQLRLVVSLPRPPAGEPLIALVGGQLRMPLNGFSLRAVPTPQGPLRAEAELTLPSAGTRDALLRVITQPDARVEYRFGSLKLTVPIDHEQREATRQMLTAYAAANRGTSR